MEAQNKLLKYTYLPRRKNVTLSELLTVVIDTYLPESYQKYLFKNYQMSETYRSYNSFVPSFLKGRPRSVIIHCLQRMKKSQRFTKTDIEFSDETNGLFHLKSQSGKVHVVDFGVMTNTPSCTCKDWIQFRIPCKHFFTVFDHAEQWKWESLPKHYLESPHITADVRVFDNQYPTVSDTTANKPFDLVCNSDDPPIPNSSDSAHITPVCGQDPASQEDSNVCNSAVPHNQVFTDGFHDIYTL